MARLVRATHDLDAEGYAVTPPWVDLHDLVFMGRPDKPGDDHQRGTV